MNRRVNKKERHSVATLTQNYKNKVKIKTDGLFELVGNYNDRAVTLYHSECGKTSELNPRYFMSKLICPQCEKEKRYEKRVNKTKNIINNFKEQLNRDFNGEYVVTKDVMDPDERKVSIKHKCGYEYKIKINSFNNGRRCPMCTKTQPKNPKQYSEEFNQATKGNFELITTYERATKKIEVLCKKCNRISLVNPSSFLRDSRCPACEKQSNKKKIEK